MTGGVTVTVAGRPGRAGLRQAPIGGKTLADLARQQPRIYFRCGTDSLHRLIGNVHQGSSRLARIHHRASKKVGGRAGDRQQRGRDQSTGRGLRDRDRLPPFDQFGGDLSRDRNEVLHRLSTLPQQAFE